MNTEFSRRELMRVAGAAAARWPVAEGAQTPKLCMLSGMTPNERGMRRIKQLGVDHAILSGPRIPWEEGQLREIIERHKAGGISVINMMIGGFGNAIYGRPGRDQDIENVQKSIRAAGRAGVAIVEYNFYAHRAIEGYYEELGRAGARMLAFDYAKVKDLPPLPEEGAHSIDEMWSNVSYFLKAVVPVAKEANVRLALHPNDPPAPISRGSGQIMGSVEGWKRLVDIVPSPYNGITFDCGVTREMGHDPVEVCRYFGQRDCINHMHFRNVRMSVPREKYVEVFPDEGDVDMFAVMKELVRLKYRWLIYPEHPRGLDADREQTPPGNYGGWIFNVAYARAMLQAAMESV